MYVFNSYTLLIYTSHCLRVPMTCPVETRHSIYFDSLLSCHFIPRFDYKVSTNPLARCSRQNVAQHCGPTGVAQSFRGKKRPLVDSFIDNEIASAIYKSSDATGEGRGIKNVVNDGRDTRRIFMKNHRYVCDSFSLFLSRLSNVRRNRFLIITIGFARRIRFYVSFFFVFEVNARVGH